MTASPMARSHSSSRLLVPRSAQFEKSSGEISTFPGAPLASPRAAPPASLRPHQVPAELASDKARRPLQDRLLEAWTDGATLDELVVLLAQALEATPLAPVRLSLVIVPAYATLDGLQWVWQASERDRVRSLHRSFGFLDEPEHLASPLHTVLETGRLLRERPTIDSEYDFLADLARAGVTDYVAIPLPHRASAPSVLSLATARDGGWNDEDVRQLWHVASVLGLMVEVSESQRLLQLAATDPLTGLSNRRSFDHSLRRAWALCERSRAPLSLAYFDIDFFKRFNDGYGHGAGDRCIAQVAAAASGAAALRATDSVARLGGEEFAVILPSCHDHGALAVGERIRAAIERLAIPHHFSPISDRVTISVGMATLTPGTGTSPSRLVEIADQALYDAKASGRNRVACRTS